MGTIKTFETTVLAAAEGEFLRALSDTRQLALAGDLLGAEWSGTELSAAAARQLLLEPGRIADKDAVWRHLVARAREAGGVWTLAAVGMAAPMLKRTAAIAAERFGGMRKDDLAAEVLAGFLEHLAGMDLERPGICVRLRWATWRAVVKAGSAEAAAPVPHDNATSMPPQLPLSHPDVVLARAELAGVITSAEADLIGMTRLDEVSLAEAAECLGVTANAAKIRRQKGEARLVAFLTGQPIPARKDLKHARTRSAQVTAPAMA
ncbi:hypothetical protein ABH935_005426 [Catenulispora sp. GAS73]|uniref:hypothetical protein n=1 Tax=Catenulispora sp. GAS73 TaxID=3156269 RepID=UPI0035172CD4